jgi:hypothetical protein
MPSKLKPALLVALGAGVVAALRKRANRNDGGEPDTHQSRRYAAPAEAGAQPPTEAGGTPSDDAQTVARSVPAEALQTQAHEVPGDAVMPDVSSDDPSVREAEAAAAADAGSIGKDADDTQP